MPFICACLGDVLKTWSSSGKAPRRLGGLPIKVPVHSLILVTDAKTIKAAGKIETA
jgi:hypothetical protein